MRYEKIINNPRPESKYPKMSATDRAAQFSSFAALTGLDEQMDETARLVDCKIELSEEEINELNRKFQRLSQLIDESDEYPLVKLTYFVPDVRKDGGMYVTKVGTVKRLDEVFHNVLFADETEVDVYDVLDFDIMEQDG